MQPQIGYDYGVYLRLRYQTRVTDRAEMAYLITKSIFIQIQRTPKVDIAIPFIYSNRAALEKRDEEQQVPGRQERRSGYLREGDPRPGW